jgi:hypothetical protein
MCSLVDIEWVIQQTAAKENRNQSIQEAVLAKSLRSDCQLFSGATGLTTEKSMWLLSEMIRFVFFQRLARHAAKWRLHLNSFVRNTVLLRHRLYVLLVNAAG